MIPDSPDRTEQVHQTFVFQGTADHGGLEDSGTALLIDVVDENDTDPDNGEWVTLHSSYADASHPRFLDLLNRRVRVTVEVLDTPEERYARETTALALEREAVEAKVDMWKREIRARGES